MNEENGLNNGGRNGNWNYVYSNRGKWNFSGVFQMNYIDEVLKRVEGAKLSSDDHGHDCSALRVYCEHELIYAYDVMVPELCARLKRAIEALKAVPMRCEDVAVILRQTENLSEQQRISEHDACLIASGYLKAIHQDFIAELEAPLEEK